MTNPYRAMCAELVELSTPVDSVSQLAERLQKLNALAARARALLDQPVAEGPTDEEIMELMPQQMRDDLAEGPSELEQALTIQKLLALVEDLERALLSAADSLEEWGGYVEPYFKAKHAFDADVANAKSHAQRARNVINGEDIIGEIDD